MLTFRKAFSLILISFLAFSFVAVSEAMADDRTIAQILEDNEETLEQLKTTQGRNQIASASGSSSYYIFRYAMGEADGSAMCLTCVVSYLTGMVSVQLFLTLFLYLSTIFFLLYSNFVFIWLSSLVVRQVIDKREGSKITRDAIGKMTWFYLTYLIITSAGAYNLQSNPTNYSVENTPPAFELVGYVPVVAMEAGYEVVERMIGQDGGFGCKESIENSILYQPETPTIVFNATATVCNIERGALVPVAIGLGIAETAFSGWDVGWNPWKALGMLVFAVIKCVIGLALMILTLLFILNILGLVFSHLFVILVQTAAMPILFLLAPYERFRGMLWTSVKKIFGSSVALFAVTVFSGVIILIFGEIGNIINVAILEGRISGFKAFQDIIPLVNDPSSIDGIRELVLRSSMDPTHDLYIPWMLTAPWFVFFMVAVLILSPLAKSFVNDVSSIVGAPAVDSMGASFAGMGVKAMAGMATLGAGAALAGYGAGKLGAKGANKLGEKTGLNRSVSEGAKALKERASAFGRRNSGDKK